MAVAAAPVPASALPGGSPSAPDYFRRTKPFWMAVIVAGMTYYGWAVFAPTTIPYNCLGSLGSFTKSLVENHSLLLKTGYLIAWLIHIGEAFYALKLCKEKGITDGHIQFLWFVQTFAFGIASLSYLLSYTPQKKRQ
uniref:Transmembrane protein 254 n=1 Tax=Pogona vitticeps TaxID=103695 RepID=A0ABM5G0G0_9SAUR